MKTTNTAAEKIIPVTADNTAWKFTPTSASLDGHTFDVAYSVSSKGDVFVFCEIGGQPIRVHVGASSPVYHDCFEAAMAAKKQPAKQAADKPAAPAKQEKPAKEPAKPVANKPAAKAAKQPKAETKSAKQAAKPAAEPAKPVEQPKPVAEPAKPVAAPADKAWIGTTITGKGWRIAFDEATQRTRVSFDADPSAKQKAAVEAAGFYFSAQLKSWNKKLTCKAYRAALALADALNALA